MFELPKPISKEELPPDVSALQATLLVNGLILNVLKINLLVDL
ncbi:MAG: hypothetical protein AAB933_00165 [Patescibacteria group bacterium]